MIQKDTWGLGGEERAGPLGKGICTRLVTVNVGVGHNIGDTY